MTKSYRAGMVGAGNICEFHVAAVKKLAPDVELVGVCDLDAERARTNAEKWGTTAHADLDALVAAGANVIHVLTPPSSHAKLAMAALERGCHVLIEKPIAAVEADARDDRRGRAPDRDQAGRDRQSLAAVRPAGQARDRLRVAPARSARSSRSISCAARSTRRTRAARYRRGTATPVIRFATSACTACT